MKFLTAQIENIFARADNSKWELMKFGDFTFHISERVEPSDTDASVYVGLEHLDPDSIHIRRKGVPSDVKGTKLRVYKGDIIFGKRRAYQRKAAIADFDGICSAHAMVIRANPAKIDPRFFPFFLHSNAFMKRAVEVSEGSLSPTIKWKILSEQKFRLPALPIQNKIADLLWAIDDVSEKINKSLNDLEVYKQAFSEQVLLSKDGEEITLKDIGEIVRGIGYKPTDVGNDVSPDYFPILRSNNIQGIGLTFNDLYFINKSRFKDSQFLREGDIVICMSNGSKVLVGKSARFESYDKPISFGSFCAAFRPHKGKYADLVEYLFQTESYRKHIKLLLTGSNINNLKPSDIESITFHISRDALSESNQSQLANLDKLAKEMKNHLANTQDVLRAVINRLPLHP